MVQKKLNCIKQSFIDSLIILKSTLLLKLKSSLRDYLFLVTWYIYIVEQKLYMLLH